VIHRGKLKDAIELSAKFLSGNDLAFYQRVWMTDLELYRQRLRAIEFVDLKDVLDAGCGMGQWTLCLGELNEHVCAIDYSPIRVETVHQIIHDVGITNIEISQKSVEALDYPDQHFDGIFCYGVLMMANYSKTLCEFYRVLKPGGKVYLSNNGLGWYIYNLINPYNPAQDYDPRQMAIGALENTMAFFTEGIRDAGKQLILPSSLVRKEMETIGFKEIRVGGEGTLQLNIGFPIQSFFPAQQYGLESVYEVLATREASTG
jgi:ubiquinone/menaquinone biosynthesis C-methylase UbiE